MEDRWRWLLIGAVAPIAWGANYWVTRTWLPVDAPLWGSVLRALPAGLVLLAISRTLPTRALAWRASVLGAVAIGGFFALVYVAAQLLPTSIASVIMATSPVTMMLFAWLLLAEVPTLWRLMGAGVGIAGVVVMLVAGAQPVNGWGIVASVSAMAVSAVGFVLAKRWMRGVDTLAHTSWQLVAGGLVLVPVAIAVEGAPPALSLSQVGAFAFVSLVATALAYVCWFMALSRLPAGAVGLVGLLNPVTGVLVGVLVAAETLTLQQGIGMLLVVGGVALGQASWGARKVASADPSPGAHVGGAARGRQHRIRHRVEQG